MTITTPPLATASVLGEKTTVRELINVLLDIDSSKTVVLSYEEDDSNTWRAIYVGKQNPNHSFQLENAIWKVSNKNPLVLANGFSPNEFLPLRGHTTVRRLINALINLHPATKLVLIGGEHSIKLTVTSGQNSINGASVWET